MARIEASIVIDRPVEEVFEFANDPKKQPLWQTGSVESEQISEGPVGVGTTFRGVGHFLGRRIEGTSEITHYEPNRRVDIKMALGPMELEESDIFEPVGDGTRVTFILEGESGGFFKLAEPLVIRMTQREYQKSLENLKDLLEAQA
jgi:uncharacterized protein YndB with AHSA1/START domain